MHDDISRLEATSRDDTPTLHADLSCPLHGLTPEAAVGQEGRDRIRSRPYAIAAVLTLDWPPDARQHLLLSDWLYVSGADSPPAGSEPAGQLIQRLLAEEQHVQWVLVAGKSEQEIIAVRRLAIEGRHREACK